MDTGLKERAESGVPRAMRRMGRSGVYRQGKEKKKRRKPERGYGGLCCVRVTVRGVRRHTGSGCGNRNSEVTQGEHTGDQPGGCADRMAERTQAGHRWSGESGGSGVECEVHHSVYTTVKVCTSQGHSCPKRHP